MGALLSRVRKQEQTLALDVTHCPPSDQSRGLRNGLFDIGFGLWAHADTDLSSTPLWSDTAAIVVECNHPLLSESTIQRITPEAGPLIVIGESTRPNASSLDVRLVSSMSDQHSVQYVHSVELLLTLVAAGYGVGITGAAHAATIQRSDLVVRSLSAGASVTTFVYVQRARESPLIERFICCAQKIAAM